MHAKRVHATPIPNMSRFCGRHRQKGRHSYYVRLLKQATNETIQKYIHSGILLNHEYGRHAIIDAIQHGNAFALGVLLKVHPMLKNLPCVIYYQNKRAVYTPIQFACKAGTKECIDILLGARVHIHSIYMLLLLCASNRVDSNCLSFLIQLCDTGVRSYARVVPSTGSGGGNSAPSTTLTSPIMLIRIPLGLRQHDIRGL